MASSCACYDISGLGQNLKKPGMLTVQNNIWQRTTVNRYAGKTTRIYLDEFHLLLKEPQTAAYTAEISKEQKPLTGVTVRDVTQLLGRDTKTLRQNVPVAGRLVQHQDKIAVFQDTKLYQVMTTKPADLAA